MERNTNDTGNKEIYNILVHKLNKMIILKEKKYEFIWNLHYFLGHPGTQKHIKN